VLFVLRSQIATSSISDAVYCEFAHIKIALNQLLDNCMACGRVLLLS
jgi:hypothetical protein